MAERLHGVSMDEKKNELVHGRTEFAKGGRGFIVVSLISTKYILISEY